MQPEYIVQVIESSLNGDVWHDCGEGPFDTFATADAFVGAEVGAAHVRICAVVPVRIYHPYPDQE